MSSRLSGKELRVLFSMFSVRQDLRAKNWQSTQRNLEKSASWMSDAHTAISHSTSTLAQCVLDFCVPVLPLLELWTILKLFLDIPLDIRHYCLVLY